MVTENNLAHNILTVLSQLVCLSIFFVTLPTYIKINIYPHPNLSGLKSQGLKTELPNWTLEDIELPRFNLILTTIRWQMLTIWTYVLLKTK